MKMSLWARKPPSSARVRMVFGVIAAVLVIFALEHFGLWPEAFVALHMRP